MNVKPRMEGINAISLSRTQDHEHLTLTATPVYATSSHAIQILRILGGDVGEVEGDDGIVQAVAHVIHPDVTDHD